MLLVCGNSIANSFEEYTNESLPQEIRSMLTFRYVCKPGAILEDVLDFVKFNMIPQYNKIVIFGLESSAWKMVQVTPNLGLLTENKEFILERVAELMEKTTLYCRKINPHVRLFLFVPSILDIFSYNEIKIIRSNTPLSCIPELFSENNMNHQMRVVHEKLQLLIGRKYKWLGKDTLSGQEILNKIYGWNYYQTFNAYLKFMKEETTYLDLRLAFTDGLHPNKTFIQEFWRKNFLVINGPAASIKAIPTSIQTPDIVPSPQMNQIQNFTTTPQQNPDLYRYFGYTVPPNSNNDAPVGLSNSNIPNYYSPHSSSFTYQSTSAINPVSFVNLPSCNYGPNTSAQNQPTEWSAYTAQGNQYFDKLPVQETLNTNYWTPASLESASRLSCDPLARLSSVSSTSLSDEMSSSPSPHRSRKKFKRDSRQSLSPALPRHRRTFRGNSRTSSRGISRTSSRKSSRSSSKRRSRTPSRKNRSYSSQRSRTHSRKNSSSSSSRRSRTLSRKNSSSSSSRRSRTPSKQNSRSQSRRKQHKHKKSHSKRDSSPFVKKKYAPLREELVSKTVCLEYVELFNLLQKMSGNFGAISKYLGILHDMFLKAFDAKKTVYECVDEDTKTLLIIVKDQLQMIVKSQNTPEIQKVVYQEALKTLMTLLKDFKDSASASKSSVTKNANFYGLNLDSLAKATKGKDFVGTIDFIKTTLLYQGIKDVSDNNLQDIYLNIKNLEKK